MTDGRSALKARQVGSIVPGVSALALGFVALAIAAVEYFVNADMAASPGGTNQGFETSFGTTAYVAGYAVAGITLVAVGIWKIIRA